MTGFEMLVLLLACKATLILGLVAGIFVLAGTTLAAELYALAEIGRHGPPGSAGGSLGSANGRHSRFVRAASNHHRR